MSQAQCVWGNRQGDALVTPPASGRPPPLRSSPPPTPQPLLPLPPRSVLVRAGRVCTIRDSRGDDEMAACGQLGNPQLSARAAPILPPPAWFVQGQERERAQGQGQERAQELEREQAQGQERERVLAERQAQGQGQERDLAQAQEQGQGQAGY